MISRRRHDGFVAWLLAVVLIGCGLFCAAVAQDAKSDKVPAEGAAESNAASPEKSGDKADTDVKVEVYEYKMTTRSSMRFCTTSRA